MKFIMHFFGGWRKGCLGPPLKALNHDALKARQIHRIQAAIETITSAVVKCSLLDVVF